MIKAAYNDKKTVIEILTSAFETDPHTAWYVNNGKRGSKKRMKTFIEYNFIHAFTHGSVYLSGNKKACALWVEYGKKVSSLRFTIAELKFLFVFGLKHLRKILSMQKYIDSQHPTGSFMHLMYIWKLPQRRTFKSIKKKILNCFIHGRFPMRKIFLYLL